MGLLEFAEKELGRIGKDEEGMQDAINKDIMELVGVFSEQGHSGFSGSYAINALTRLLNWKPISPLTGEDSEWNDVGDNMQQNNRCPTVFRHNKDNSTAYDIEGKVFSDDGGQTWFTNRNSHVPVLFPYHVPDNPEFEIIGEFENEEEN